MPLLNLVDGKWTARMHEGQQAAFESEKRVVAVIAGGRSGKTAWGPLWLHREMVRKGPGDYLVAAPSYQLIDKAAGPEIEHVFGQVLHLGEMRRSPSWQFAFHKTVALPGWGKLERPARIIIGHADKPETLEAMRARAAWLDEAGQSGFKEGSWEAVQQRLANDQGRVLITSKPYNLGWLKRLIWDPWMASGRNHPEIDVFSFDSRMNPDFPPEEYERARRTLPKWRFDMMYRGLFTKPAGVIYDCFDSRLHTCPRFAVPHDWPRYLGLDFGAVNTAAVFLAAELDARKTPTGRVFLYRTYHPARRGDARLTPAEHVAALLADEPRDRLGKPRLPTAVGGSHSEGEWRGQFAAAGLYVMEPPIKDVEVGIDRVHSLIRANRLIVFGDLVDFLDEVQTYSRELNDAGEPTEKIEAKETFHLLDGARYIIAWLWQGADGEVQVGQFKGSDFGAPPGVFQTDVDERGRTRDRDTGAATGGGIPLWPDNW